MCRDIRGKHLFAFRGIHLDDCYTALAYELDRRALAKMLDETPALMQTLAETLALLAWRESNPGSPDLDPPPAVLARLVNLYRGQIEANYGESVAPAVSAGAA
jgi:hypothetical protein